MLITTQPHVAHRDLLRHTSLIDPQLPAWQSPDIADVLIVPLRQDRDLFGAALVALGHGAAQDRVAVDAERRLAERLGLGLANARLVARLDALSLGTLRAFGSTIDANSRWTAGHSERVTQIAVQLGDALGLTSAERLTLTRGCLLHDIGKVGIPAAILDKSDRLTAAEFAIVQQHPVIGAEILGSVAAFRDLLPIVRSHHERFDGRGYPDGLQGEAIPWLARIAAVADVFDALASARPYRDGLPLDTVRGIITDGCGTHFDPRVVEAFEALLDTDRLVVPPSSRSGVVTSRPFADAFSDASHLFPAIV
jgi:putative nucleotidyltransferase with HDIG domain